MEGSAESRANKYLGKPAKDVPGGGYCCKWTAYVVLGDSSKNQGGANGWTSYGSTATSENAEFICTSSHVAPIVNGKVYNSPGVGSTKEIKTYSIKDAQQYIFGGKGQLRKQ